MVPLWPRLVAATAAPVWVRLAFQMLVIWALLLNDHLAVQPLIALDPRLVTVTLAPTSSQTVTVGYATANGTATAGSDYVSAFGTLSFAAGETTKTVSVTINGDTAVEPNEAFFLNLLNATGGVAIADAQGVGTITNDDLGAPSVAIDDVAVTEGNAGTSTVLPRHFHRVISGNQVRRQPGGSRAAKARNGQRT